MLANSSKARLETFTDPIDLEFLFEFSEDEDEEGKVVRKSRKRRMRERVSLQLAETASSYGLVRFNPLVVTDERLIKMVIAQVNVESKHAISDRAIKVSK